MLKGDGYLTDPKVLDQQPWFLVKQEHTIRNFCDSFFRKYKIRPEIHNEFSCSVTCYRMAAAGMGFTIVPFMVNKLTYPGMEMEQYSLRMETVTWDIKMYYRRDAYLSHPEHNMLRMAQQLFNHEMLTHD